MKHQPIPLESGFTACADCIIGDSRLLLSRWVAEYKRSLPARPGKADTQVPLSFPHPHVDRLCRMVVQNGGRTAVPGALCNGLALLLPSCKWRGLENIVYGWCHKSSGASRVYVGSTVRTLRERAAEHLGSAARLKKADYRFHRPEFQCGQLLKGRHLYEALGRSGFGDFVVFPLQVVPKCDSEDATKAAVRCAEQFWMDALNSLTPGGYNSVRAVALQAMVGKYDHRLIIPARAYGFHCMSRRLQHICRCVVSVGPPQADPDGPVVLDNSPPPTRLVLGDRVCGLQFFKGYKLFVLEKLFSFTTNIMDRAHTPPAGTADHYLAVRNIVRSVIEHRLARSHRCGVLLTFLYKGVPMDGLDFAAACDRNAHLLEHGVQTHPVVGFKFDKPLGRTWVNAAKVVKSWRERPPCRCQEACFAGFIPAGASHVCTTDGAILDAVRDPHKHARVSSVALRSLWNHGYKHRPFGVAARSAVSHSDKECVKASLRAGFVRYAKRLADKFPGESHNIGLWWRAVLADLLDQLEVITQPAEWARLVQARSTAEEVCPEFDPAALRSFIRDMHKDLVVIRCDKLPYTYAAMCPAWFYDVLQVDLSSQHFAPAEGSSGYVLATLAERLGPQFRHLFGAEGLAYPGVLAKLHKPSLKFRMLACCGQYVFKDLGKLVTACLKAVEPHLEVLWQRELDKVGWGKVGKVGPYHVWSVKNSAAAVRRIQQLNLYQRPAAGFLHPGGVKGKDFQCMYTHVPQESLIARLQSFALEPVWAYMHEQLHDGAQPAPGAADASLPWLRVYADRRRPPAWFVSKAAAVAATVKGTAKWHDPHGKDRFGRFHILSLAEVKHLVHVLVSNSYVECFGEVYKQVCGIPMGVSPGVFFANMFLFSFEMEHMQQLIRVYQQHPTSLGLGEAQYFGAQLCHEFKRSGSAIAEGDLGSVAVFLWSQWKYVWRFVDDLQTVGHMFLDDMLCNTQHVLGTCIVGVYPAECPLEDTSPAPGAYDCVPFLDIGQRFGVVQGAREQVVFVVTGVYSRLQEPCFQRLRPVHYTHASSCVSRQCMANIAVGQLSRFCILCSNPDRLRSAVGVLLTGLVQQGHQPANLWRYVKQYVRRHPLRVPGGVPCAGFLDSLRPTFIGLGFTPAVQTKPVNSGRRVRRRLG